jgi:energy-coupling factor transporter transmembrane protein EcfT
VGIGSGIIFSIYAFVSAMNCWVMDKEPLAMFRSWHVELGRVGSVKVLFLGMRILLISVVLALLFSVMGGPSEFTYGLDIYLFTVLFISECVWAMLHKLHNLVDSRYVKQGMSLYFAQ